VGVKLTFHGAARCVTGSCMRLTTKRADVLIDCGMFQGSKTLKAMNYEAFPFKAAKLDAVLLTHAHIDHSGLLPKLMLAGYAGPILATAGTRELCAVMLPDSGAIQEMEVETLNRRNERRGLPTVQPIYTAEDAHEAMRLFKSVAYDQWVEVAPGVRARWWDAGHILGSASIEVEVRDEDSDGPMRLLFSGDVGSGGRDYAADPRGPEGVDHLIMESTYGGSERPAMSPEARRKALAEEVKAAHAAGGPLVIPAFAVERTQELLADLIELMEDVEAPPGPIFLDSPLAIKATNVFLSQGYSAGRGNPFAKLRESRLLRFTESVNESRDIERMKGWHVIIAASGMCDAGRIRHHLKRLLWRSEATLMLVGFQPVGTLGRLLQDGVTDVRIQGEPVRVRARVRSVDWYSGHADGAALVRWANARKPVSGTVYLDHGEQANIDALRERLLSAGFDGDCLVAPKLDQTFALELHAAKSADGAAAPRMAPDDVSRLDWHNARARFLSDLSAAMDRAPDNAARKALFERLSADIEASKGNA